MSSIIRDMHRCRRNIKKRPTVKELEEDAFHVTVGLELAAILIIGIILYW